MKALPFVITILVTAAIAAPGHSDGLPVLGIDVGSQGVARPGGQYRFVTVPVKRNTLLVAVERRSDHLGGHRLLPGRWTIPAVAYDGSAAGLSADGQTLVVVRPRARFPRPRSPFALVDTTTLRMKPFTLGGDFSFDAISPDGRLVYLIQYTDLEDPTRYAVRLYDVGRGRLAPEPIVDPHEPDEAMRGMPLSRVSSPDGRWAYTLYDGGGSTPFIHALDTVDRTARCIDLDALAAFAGGDTSQLSMRRSGERLVVNDGRSPLALVSTATLAVSDPAPPGAAEPSPKEDARSWWVLALTATALAAVFGLAVSRVLPGMRAPRRSA
jgi:hypothetical protein